MHRSRCSRHSRLLSLSTQKCEEVRRFLYEVGNTLRVLDRGGTQWADLALGCCIMEIADLQESDALMMFWDCLERRIQIMNLTLHGTTARRIKSMQSD